MPPAVGVSPRDRTAEFSALVERLKKQPGVSTSADGTSTAGVIQNRANGGAAAQQSEFARKASLIGRSIHDTSTKLQKLAQLAKRTSMFDDPAEEIDRMTTVVKRDIQDLNSAIADLQKIAASNRDGNKQSSYHSTTVVDNLRSRLKDTTKAFKDVLTVRTDNLKVHQNRREMYSAARGSQGNMPRAPTGIGGAMPMLPRPNHSKSAHELFGGAPKGSLQGAGSESTPLLSKYDPPSGQLTPISQPHAHASSFVSPSNSFSQPEIRRRKGLAQAGPPSFGQDPPGSSSSGGQAMQQELVAPQDSYMSTRAEALRNVESTIVELGGIFQQLAHMVQEQGELAVRIDENVEDTLQNVEGAQAHLLKYLNTISSNRWLIMKIFFVLMIFMLFFVVFIV